MRRQATVPVCSSCDGKYPARDRIIYTIVVLPDAVRPQGHVLIAAARSLIGCSCNEARGGGRSKAGLFTGSNETGRGRVNRSPTSNAWFSSGNVTNTSLETAVFVDRVLERLETADVLIRPLAMPQEHAEGCQRWRAVPRSSCSRPGRGRRRRNCRAREGFPLRNRRVCQHPPARSSRSTGITASAAPKAATSARRFDKLCRRGRDPARIRRGRRVDAWTGWAAALQDLDRLPVRAARPQASTSTCANRASTPPRRRARRCFR